MLILLAMPVIEIILFGFAISTEVKNARIVVLDPSDDAITRRLTDRLDASEYFTVSHTVGSPEEMQALFRANRADLGVVFSPRFADNLPTREATIQLVADATDPNTATLQVNYATRIIRSEEALFQGSIPGGGIDLKLLYNPGMKSAYNFVPGVMGLILMLICAMMTSISIVREKETGTMEVLLVSPVRPFFVILSKMIPYFLLSFVNLASILLLSVFVLNVPVSGSLASLIAVSLLFIFVALSLGVLISSVATTQVAAMLASGLILMMPTVLLSGMIFPVESMPLPLRALSALIPARWYIDVVRRLMIQGAGIQYMLKETGILLLMGVVFTTVSLKKFKNRL